MKWLVAFSFITLLASCKHPVVPDPDPSELREVTFYIKDNNEPQMPTRNHMVCRIGDWDSLLTVTSAITEFNKTGELYDTVQFYYQPIQGQFSRAHRIIELRISIEKGYTFEWQKNLDPDEFPDTLEAVIRD